MKRLTTMLAYASTLLITTPAEAQTSYTDVKNSLDAFIKKPTSNGRLLTQKGIDLFMQNRVNNNLTGSSDLSFSKAYFTYSGEDDKLSLGYNLWWMQYDKKDKIKWLPSVINPIFETGLKDNFAPLYDGSKWQAGIRGGLRMTWIISSLNTVSYAKICNGSNWQQQARMINIRRAKKEEIDAKIDNEATALDKYNKLDNTTISVLKEHIDSDKDCKDKSTTHLSGTINDATDYAEKLEDYELEIAKAEVEEMKKKNSYNWARVCWVSIWGYTRITGNEYNVSLFPSTSLSPVKYNDKELNIQGNMLLENRWLQSYFSLTCQYMRNNTVMAKIRMTEIDFEKFVPATPSNDTLNYGKLSSDKSYWGYFKEFNTYSVSIQSTFLLGTRADWDIKPGINIKISQYFGDMGYYPTNLTLGIPLSLRGKETPINIEPQLRIQNVFNNADNPVNKTTFGISVGVPIIPVYK